MTSASTTAKTSGVVLIENEARLGTIYLNPKGKGLQQYQGETPFDLRFGQPRDEVRAVLGEPTRIISTLADEFDQGSGPSKLHTTTAA